MPDMNTSQTPEPLEVQLVANLYRKRKKSVTLKQIHLAPTPRSLSISMSSANASPGFLAS
jgi:hypothetical protein